jgi:phenylpropionate dioxygenase-like ring-hydroxylating dioxygenase large terminal subunit
MICGTVALYCRYDILVENLMDAPHVPYAHKGIMRGIHKKEDPRRFSWTLLMSRTVPKFTGKYSFGKPYMDVLTPQCIRTKELLINQLLKLEKREYECVKILSM